MLSMIHALLNRVAAVKEMHAHTKPVLFMFWRPKGTSSHFNLDWLRAEKGEIKYEVVVGLIQATISVPFDVNKGSN